MTQNLVLSDYLSGRDNNFNLIRMVAASAVLVSHSFPISQGQGVDEPLEATLGFSLGLLAVYAFFILSGFLVANSLKRRSSIKSFLWARSLRIIPGLFVAICLCAFAIGPLFTEMSLANYLTSNEVYSYVLKNISFVELQYKLPATFEMNTYPNAVNGSLWTLPYEVYCYIALALVGYLGLFQKKENIVYLALLYLSLWTVMLYFPLPSIIETKLSIFLDLGFGFLIGICAFIYRKHIKINSKYLSLLLLLTFLAFGTILFRPIFIIALGYLLFWLSYVPKGRIRSYNKIGDYSYGVYIYAFPVQQSLMYLHPNLSAESLIINAFLITLPLGVLSWHFIEKPALGMKKKFIN